MDWKGTNLRLAIPVWKRIDRIAKQNHRSVTNQMELWVVKMFEQEEKKK